MHRVSFPNHALSPARMLGFTLLEVLIAVVILSIGLLGVAGLQATGMRNNHDAYLRSQATVLAMDISDAMRANRGMEPGPAANTALGGAYNINFNAVPPLTSNAMADIDIRNWKASLAALLPSGDGQITQAGTVFTIDIRWTDADDRNALISFRTRTAL